MSFFGNKGPDPFSNQTVMNGIATNFLGAKDSGAQGSTTPAPLPTQPETPATPATIPTPPSVKPPTLGASTTAAGRRATPNLGGLGSTILTSGAGLTTRANVAGKTLLGQ